MYPEYKEDINLRSFLLQTKNNLIIKSFIIVFTMIGIFICDKNFIPEKYKFNILLYVIPYFMLVPIASRVSYYRTWCAYLSAKINVLTNNKTDNFPEISFLQHYDTSKSKINNFKLFIHKTICIMVNFELFILSLCCFFILLIKISFSTYNILSLSICLLISICSNIYIFFVFMYVSNYEKLYNSNKIKWIIYKNIRQN